MKNTENKNQNQTEYIKQLEETCRLQKAEIALQKTQIEALEARSIG